MAIGEIPTVTIEQLPSLEDSAAVEFRSIVEERQLHKSEEDRHKKLREDLDKRIEAMLLVAGAADGQLRVQVDQWVVQRVTSKSADKLEPRRLVELGVSTSIIQQATVEGKQYSYVLIKQVKQ